MMHTFKIRINISMIIILLMIYLLLTKATQAKHVILYTFKSVFTTVNLGKKQEQTLAKTFFVSARYELWLSYLCTFKQASK